MEDVIMSDSTKEENQLKETKDNSLYQEYKKVLVNIEKAVTLKDTKTLYLCTRLLNKFRKGFTDEDCQFIVDNFLRTKFPFSFISNLEAKSKVTLYIIIILIY